MANLETMASESVKSTLDFFEADEYVTSKKAFGCDGEASKRMKTADRVAREYFVASSKTLGAKRDGSSRAELQIRNSGESIPISSPKEILEQRQPDSELASEVADGEERGITVYTSSTKRKMDTEGASAASLALVVGRRKGIEVPKPEWHAPWKLQSVISGHLGWVRAVAFDPGNEWFVTGSNDRTIKVWDLAKCCVGMQGGLKLTLTGHIHTVRGLAISHRHPYMFSAGEDKKVMCWDLEYNRVVRHYHGHLSAVFALKLHPTLDILFSAGRDGATRVWDIRTKQQVHILTGHTNAVGALAVNATDPQVITGSHDCTIKLWDLAAGKVFSTLTHHKKAVRDLAVNDRDEFSFVSAGADNLKKWQARDGLFLHNLSGHSAIVNTLSLNEDGVLFSGGDNGSMTLWDYTTGHPFQTIDSAVQPGSLDAEAGIYASSFDMSGGRLVTCEADKTIKIWREDDSASPESHPIDMKKWTKDYHIRRRHA